VQAINNKLAQKQSPNTFIPSTLRNFFLSITHHPLTVLSSWTDKAYADFSIAYASAVEGAPRLSLCLM
jgi:hypothetical protein